MADAPNQVLKKVVEYHPVRNACPRPNDLRAPPLNRDLDRTDFAILSALQNDARLSNKELAAKIRLAPSSCLERVRRLRKLGVLRSSHARVDPRALGVELQAMIAIQLGQHAPELVAAFRDEMLARPETVAVYYLAGTVDFLVHVAVRDADHLRTVASEAAARVDAVRQVETSLIFEHHVRPGLPCYRDAGDGVRGSAAPRRGP